MSYRAVIFDLGGVVFPSPFEAFDEYEREAGLPTGAVRGVIRTSSETGAWAALERGEHTLDGFFAALESEFTSAGHAIDARALLGGVGRGFGPRPEMVEAIARIRDAGLLVAALTNNWSDARGRPSPNGVDSMDVFDVVVESSVEGIRKPDPRIYELTLARLAVDAAAVVFLDDLGINLKPARAMGMATIKVADPIDALRELESVLGFPLLDT
ncbi:MAG: HAD-IA family hydrolase [Acidimicrobiia bacterium]|nr:HAD-IA family hydrolase [Acidimicrobiia bacterium]